MFALETIGLTKDYLLGFWRKRPVRALDGLNLQIQGGEIFGLLGPNGAGKTTTLKILLRLVFPTSGTARILGKDFHDISSHARIGYLPEQPYFYDHLTAEEFMTYMAEIFSIEPTLRHKRIGNLLERLGLWEHRAIPLRKFSKGMVQRVGIAQALLNDPELVFLDEPMSGLDPVGRREVRDLILDLKEKGKTVLFSTHILSDAEALCDRVAILNRGRLQGCGGLNSILGLEASVTEVVLKAPAAEVLSQVSRLASSVVRAGDSVRLSITSEADVRRVLEIALAHGAKILALNSVRGSLEDYFLSQVVEPSGKPGRTEPTLAPVAKKSSS